MWIMLLRGWISRKWSIMEVREGDMMCPVQSLIDLATITIGRWMNKNNDTTETPLLSAEKGYHQSKTTQHNAKLPHITSRKPGNPQWNQRQGRKISPTIPIPRRAQIVYIQHIRPLLHQNLPDAIPSAPRPIWRVPPPHLEPLCMRSLGDGANALELPLACAPGEEEGDGVVEEFAERLGGVEGG
jgi:hypothetical protein